MLKVFCYLSKIQQTLKDEHVEGGTAGDCVHQRVFDLSTVLLKHVKMGHFSNVRYLMVHKFQHSYEMYESSV